MVSVTITEKGGKPTVREFDQAEITIGRVQGNDIVLPKSNISKRHARIVRNSGSYVVIDAKSTNGTYINGKRLSAPHDLRPGDKIFVGDFTLELRATEENRKVSRSEAERRQLKTKELSAASEEGVLSSDAWLGNHDDEWSAEWSEQAEENPSQSSELNADPAPPSKSGSRRKSDLNRSREPSGKTRHQAERGQSPADDRSDVVRVVHKRLSESVSMNPANLEEPERRARTASAVRDIVKTMEQEGELPEGMEPRQVASLALAEAVGMGPLGVLLNDPSVSEILVNNARQIYVERAGRLELTNLQFSSDAAVLALIERIVTPLGRRINEKTPMVDARLRDGSRVNAIIAPLALRGPTLTIRKFNREPLQIDDLVAGGTLTADMAEFIEVCVQARKNIIISGGTGCGKTTLLNVISGFIESHERIITIEDAAELQLDQDHVVALEARPADVDGREEIAIRDLVRNALRMRPDRIIVGECRGGEALDMLQAMNTGHDGCLTTVHANGPRDALSRLETMVLMSGIELPMRAIRDQVASAVDIIIQQSRFLDGTRRITHISELVGMEGDIISMHDLFVFEQQGFSDDGRVQGRFRASGFVPQFYESLRAIGIEPNLAIFRNS